MARKQNKPDPNGGYTRQGSKGPELTEAARAAKERVEQGAAETEAKEKEKNATD